MAANNPQTTDPLDPCLVKREPGEPMFLLLARDSAAPRAMECWADNREIEIGRGLRPDTPQERAHISEVRAKVVTFRAWRKANRG